MTGNSRLTHICDFVYKHFVLPLERLTNYSFDTPWAAWEEAAMAGDTEGTLFILRSKEIPIGSYKWEQALNRALASGHANTFAALVDCGLPIQGRHLMTAARQEHVNCLEMLLDRGFDINYRDDRGNTALMAAAGVYTGDFYTKARGIHIDALSAQENLVLTRSKGLGDPTVLRLMDDSIEVGDPDPTSFPASIRLLLSRGAQVNLANFEGETALMGASQIGDIEILRILLDAGAEVNAINIDGFNALTFAAIKGHREAVNLLLTHNIDATIKDVKGYSILERAEQYEQSSIVDVLKNSLDTL